MARILVVDDDSFVRAALVRVLCRFGHEVEATGSPTDGLYRAIHDRPDLMVLDYRMPELDGAEVYRRVRASLGVSCPPVLFVSADRKRDERRFR